MTDAQKPMTDRFDDRVKAVRSEAIFDFVTALAGEDTPTKKYFNNRPDILVGLICDRIANKFRPLLDEQRATIAEKQKTIDILSNTMEERVSDIHRITEDRTVVIDKLTAFMDRQQATIAERDKEIGRLRGLVLQHGRHKENCQGWRKDVSCICGWSDTKAALSEQPERKEG